MSAQVVCKVEGCTAPQGGECANGLSIEDCPDATRAAPNGAASPTDAAPPVSVSATEPVTPAGPAFRSSTALTLDEAQALMAEHSARIVLPVGAIESGKTTLLVGLYEKFLMGPWGDVSFVCSDTLLDFEMLAYPGRLNSKADLPTTWRTKLDSDSPSLLHLALHTPVVDRLDLLLANVSGEAFRRVADGAPPSVELPLARAADGLIFCLDGAKLAVPAQQDIVIDDMWQVLQRLREEQLPKSSCRVVLLLTKLDEVEGEVDAGWDAAKERLGDLLSDLGAGDVTCIRTSARHAQGAVQDDGMEELLHWLVAAKPEREPLEITDAPTSPRAFGRYEDMS